MLSLISDVAMLSSKLFKKETVPPKTDLFPRSDAIVRNFEFSACQ